MTVTVTVMVMAMANPRRGRRPALRYHGDLGAVTDSERRGLRPIGAAVRDVASWTGALLGEVAARPTVHIVQGVRLDGPDTPCVPHAISAGRHVVFIESVTWPSGRYFLADGDRVYCDDVRIGQSVRPLIAAVRRWRQILPSDHRVSALVAVHPIGDGPVLLPGPQSRELVWALSQSVVRDLCQLLPTRQRSVSGTALAALVAASVDPRG